MRCLVPAVLCLTGLSLFVSSPAFSADNYSVDPSHCSVIFGVSHLGFSYVYGRFNNAGGSYTLDKENPAASLFKFTVETASVDTNDAKRDEHLRGPDFFNSKQFPQITFESKEITVSHDESGTTVYQVTGDLTMHGTTQSVTVPLRLLKEGPGMGGQVRSGFLSETRLMRSDFGMGNMAPAIGDEIAITISFEGVRQ